MRGRWSNYLVPARRITALAWIIPLAGFMALGIVSAGWRMSQPRLNDARFIVFGLDAATWDIIDPLLEQDKLPNLKRLIDSGARADFISLEPIRSPLVWTSIATGRPPEAHGVEGFFSTRLDLRVPRLWDVAHAARLRVGLFRWLTTWPVLDSFEFVVPSWIARSPEAWPADCGCIQQTLLEQGVDGAYNPASALFGCARLGAGAGAIDRMTWFYLSDAVGLSEEERLERKALSEVRLQTDLFIALMRRHRPNAAAFCLYGTDQLGHRFWHYMKPDQFHSPPPNACPEFASVIERYYHAADRAIGRVLRSLPPDCRVAVISDHGMKADPALPGQYFADMDAILSALGRRGEFRHHTIERHILIDPAPGHENQLDALANGLGRIHFTGDEDPIFTTEREGNTLSVRTNFSLTAHPDSPLAQNPTIEIAGETIPTGRLFFVRYFSGTHDLKGVMVLHGPGVRAGARLGEVSLLDFAPTALYWLDLPISREMEGRVVSEAFKEGALEARPAKYVDEYPALRENGGEVPGDQNAFMERLRSLGYVE